ncbi:MAG: DUF1295 domain-containing protein [Gammaproteobacteria bacterium]
MFQIWLNTLPLLLGLGLLGWWISARRNDVGIVDSLWGLFFLLALIGYQFADMNDGGLSNATQGLARDMIIGTLVLIWSMRLSAHITLRNHGKPEDRRYREIRERNEPNFRLKSLYLVFGLQAVLAWLISAPLLAAIQPGVDANEIPAFNWLDVFGIGLWLIGFAFESISDAQLARFQADPKSEGKVMDQGLWRYSRHPNYFGEFCIWWGYFLIAAAAGGWWTIFAPIIMTILLLRVSGVHLMETGMDSRRPGYADYVRRTSAFFPAPPKQA